MSQNTAAVTGWMLHERQCYPSISLYRLMLMFGNTGRTLGPRTITKVVTFLPLAQVRHVMIAFMSFRRERRDSTTLTFLIQCLARPNKTRNQTTIERDAVNTVWASDLR